MRILALNATYRSEGTTTRLTQKALEGAASMGAETEMVLLKDLRLPAPLLLFWLLAPDFWVVTFFERMRLKKCIKSAHQ